MVINTKNIEPFKFKKAALTLLSIWDTGKNKSFESFSNLRWIPCPYSLIWDTDTYLQSKKV